MTSERNKSVQVRTAAYQMVRRLRTELNIVLFTGRFRFVARRRNGLFRRSGFFADTEHVAGAALGVQQESFAGSVNFAAQAVDIDFDQVGKGIEVFVPDVFGDFSAADDASGVADEVFEQRVFLVGKRDAAIAASGNLRGGIERQIRDGQLRGFEF